MIPCVVMGNSFQSFRLLLPSKVRAVHPEVSFLEKQLNITEVSIRNHTYQPLVPGKGLACLGLPPTSQPLSTIS